MDSTNTVVKCNHCHQHITLRPDQSKRLKTALTLQDVCPHCQQVFTIDLMKRPSLPPRPSVARGLLAPTMPPEPAMPQAPLAAPPFGMLDQGKPQAARLPPF